MADEFTQEELDAEIARGKHDEFTPEEIQSEIALMRQEQQQPPQDSWLRFGLKTGLGTVGALGGAVAGGLATTPTIAGVPAGVAGGAILGGASGETAGGTVADWIEGPAKRTTTPLQDFGYGAAAGAVGEAIGPALFKGVPALARGIGLIGEAAPKAAPFIPQVLRPISEAAEQGLLPAAKRAGPLAEQVETKLLPNLEGRVSSSAQSLAQQHAAEVGSFEAKPLIQGEALTRTPNIIQSEQQKVIDSAKKFLDIENIGSPDQEIIERLSSPTPSRILDTSGKNYLSLGDNISEEVVGRQFGQANLVDLMNASSRYRATLERGVFNGKTLSKADSDALGILADSIDSIVARKMENFSPEAFAELQKLRQQRNLLASARDPLNKLASDSIKERGQETATTLLTMFGLGKGLSTLGQPLIAGAAYAKGAIGATRLGQELMSGTASDRTIAMLTKATGMSAAQNRNLQRGLSQLISHATTGGVVDQASAALTPDQPFPRDSQAVSANAEAFMNRFYVLANQLGHTDQEIKPMLDDIGRVLIEGGQDEQEKLLSGLARQLPGLFENSTYPSEMNGNIPDDRDASAAAATFMQKVIRRDGNLVINMKQWSQMNDPRDRRLLAGKPQNPNYSTGVRTSVTDLSKPMSGAKY